MSLDHAQQPRKMMLFSKLHEKKKKITAKNNARARLSVAVSVMGKPRPPVPTSM